MNRSDVILLEDKDFYAINKVHKNVLKASENAYNAKSKIYYDPSERNECDEMIISNKILDFVSDGIKFDPQVVKTKATYALPYNPRYVKEIFQNRKDLGNDVIIEPDKYKNQYKTKYKSIDMEQKIDKITESNADVKGPEIKAIKFRPRVYFISNKLSLSDDQLAIESENRVKSAKRSNFTDITMTKSLTNLSESAEEGFFITETRDNNDNSIQNESTSINSDQDENYESIIKESLKKSSETSLRSSLNERDVLKTLTEINWDDHLINLLSENTARWLVLKRVTDPKQKQKLLEIVEKKFGRYTRDIRDLELVEDSLTDFEKRKIAEEKQRLKLEKANKLSIINEGENGMGSKDNIPVYRLPQGVKREYLEKLKIPDPNFNKTAREINVEESRIISPKTYEQRMQEKNVTNMSMLNSNNEYQAEIIAGNSKHKYTNDENLILLKNGKKFVKTMQVVYPADFTAWVSGVELKPNDKPEMKKPIKGKKRWKNMPVLIENDTMNDPSHEPPNNYWQLMTATPDTELRKVLKSNNTVARIVEEWRRKWQTSNRWTLAEIDDLISDMKHDQANVRFQAVVVCSRAVEQIHSMLDKLKQQKRQFKKTKDHNSNDNDSSSNHTYDFDSSIVCDNRDNQIYYLKDTVFSEPLFDAVEGLLNDSNNKVKLAAAITIFTILRRFTRPMIMKYQVAKNKAENFVRQTLESYNNGDRYAAAQCLAIDGIFEKRIIDILLTNYFNSNEQVTKEQVTRSLSFLSADHSMVCSMVGEYLSNEHPRYRILACKLIPCLRRTPNKEITSKLIDLMWNDINKQVKKVAAQTLGRTGKAREVHEEIFTRLQSKNVFDRVESLKKINYIGIMTSKLLPIYLKCFRDDYISVREMACKSARNLYEKDEKILSSLVFMARFDHVPKLKASAIQTLGLIGDFRPDIRNSLIWALQFEVDPLIRTQACHSIILLVTNPKDDELIDILLERHLVEEEPIVKSEIMEALKYLGFDSNRELPIVTKIKADVKKLNDKSVIIEKIKQLEKELNFEADKKRLIWTDDKPERTNRKNFDDNNDNNSIEASTHSFSTYEQQYLAPKFEPVKIKTPISSKKNSKKSTDVDSIEQINSYIEKISRQEKFIEFPMQSEQTLITANSFLSKLVFQPQIQPDSTPNSNSKITSITSSISRKSSKSITEQSDKKNSIENTNTKTSDTNSVEDQASTRKKSSPKGSIELLNIKSVTNSLAPSIGSISSHRINTIQEEKD